LPGRAIVRRRLLLMAAACTQPAGSTTHFKKQLSCQL